MRSSSSSSSVGKGLVAFLGRVPVVVGEDYGVGLGEIDAAAPGHAEEEDGDVR